MADNEAILQAVKDLVARVERAEKDIVALYKSTNGIDVLVGKIQTSIDYMQKSIDTMILNIAELKGASGKKWDLVVTSAITAIVVAAISYFLK